MFCVCAALALSLWCKCECVALTGLTRSTSSDDYHATWETVRKDLMWVPAKRKADRVASATPAERIEATKVCSVCLSPDALILRA